LSAARHDPLNASRWALLAGNFAIGCGVMVVPGALNDIAQSLAVSVALAGQLVAIAAVVMCFGAPLAAGFVASLDRRRLLTVTLLWWGAGHALSALCTSYAALVPLRALTVVAAAIFTPQAAAAIGTMSPPEQRGRSITFIFLGWSMASVLGMPVHSYIGEAVGWPWAFALVAALSAAAALWVWRAMPDGIKPPPLSLAAWKDVFTSPVLMAIVLVTALSGAGQFTLFSYFAPYYREVFGAGAAEISLLFFWFGAAGLVGNVLLSRTIDRIGAARAVFGTLVLIAVSLAAWPLAGGIAAIALVLLPWGFGCFSSNSAQQARLGLAAPALAPALLALNSSAIYLGQALGASSGGALVGAFDGYAALNWVGLAWLLAAIALSVWAERRSGRPDLAHV
jgi:predicted MFS family arabinose efflux permease